MQVKKSSFPLRLPKELNQQLNEVVMNLGMTKNSFVLSLIHKELAKIKSHNKQSIQEGSR